MFKLQDRTKSKEWNYDSERQLITAARLYKVQHPKSVVAVVVNGRTGILM